MTRNELLAATGLASGGTATRRLDELEESGFVQRHIPFGKKENDALFRLADEFSQLYVPQGFPPRLFEPRRNDAALSKKNAN